MNQTLQLKLDEMTEPNQRQENGSKAIIRNLHVVF